MFKTLLKIIISFFIFSISSISLALGFGKINVYSYLNEKLNAEIELIGSENIDSELLIAELANPEDFVRAGITRSYFLTKLEFDIIRFQGKTVIYITSKTPVKHPYLDFLVELSWPNGRLVKGYTILIDPPSVKTDLTNRAMPLAKKYYLSNTSTKIRPINKAMKQSTASDKTTSMTIEELSENIKEDTEQESNLTENLSNEIINNISEVAETEVLDDIVTTLKNPIFDSSGIDSQKLIKQNTPEVEQKKEEITNNIHMPKEPIKEVKEQTIKATESLSKKYSLQLLLTLLVVLVISMFAVKVLKRSENSGIAGSIEPDKSAIESDDKNDNLQQNMGSDLSEHSDIELLDESLDLNEIPSEITESFDILASDKEEIGVKIDLAKQYLDADDKESAKKILTELFAETTDASQKEEIQSLLAKLSDI